MAAMIQTKGYKQGFFIDPANLEMLLENEAMAEALRLLKVSTQTYCYVQHHTAAQGAAHGAAHGSQAT